MVVVPDKISAVISADGNAPTRLLLINVTLVTTVPVHTTVLQLQGVVRSVLHVFQLVPVVASKNFFHAAWEVSVGALVAVGGRDVGVGEGVDVPADGAVLLLGAGETLPPLGELVVAAQTE